MESGELKLRTLEENLELSGLQRRPIPEGIVGFTESSGVVILNIVGRSGTRRAGGSRASASIYRAQTLIAHPTVESAKSILVERASVYFPGEYLLRWGDFDVIRESWSTDDEGRVQQGSIELTKGSTLTSDSNGNLLLHLTPIWTVGQGQPGQRIVDSGLNVAVEARRPTPFTRLLIPLVRAQELLNLAFRGFLRAQAGKVVFGSPRKKLEAFCGILG